MRKNAGGEISRERGQKEKQTSPTPPTRITADAGDHSEVNLAALAALHVDALIADNDMRSRDERFADQGRHRAKPDSAHDKSATRHGVG